MADQSCVWLFGCKTVCGLSLQPIGCTPALSVTQSAAAAAVCGVWHYISVKHYLFFVFLEHYCPTTSTNLEFCSVTSAQLHEWHAKEQHN